ncbi:MAG TPA: tetratricopeptide repeat protein [Vicinamibacterales bacterium]|nr:tetratricopeptide repeat protein [Vicinamibacterales bacterium]
MPRVRSATGEALNRYVQGDYAGAIEFLQQLGGFNVLQAQEWIKAEGLGAADRRRLAAATMVLEYTAARPNLSPPLIEWACEQLARYPTPAIEELWLRASIALIEGRQAWTILTGATSNHLAHARTRFPDNTPFKLAEAVSAEATADDASVRPADRGMVIDRLWGEMLDQPSDKGSKAAALLEQAAATLEGLVSDETVGAEARLRLGFIHLRLGRREQALQQFKQVEGVPRDAALKYLGLLFSGWTLARDGRTDEAIAAYRAALEVIPRARSATTLLTMLLVMNHKLGDAEMVTDAFMNAPLTVEDPWRTYQLGSYRSYQGLIDQLREAIR